MSAHTLGPWYFNTAENCIARGEESGDVRIAYLDDDSREDKANAALIAAAPDMLAALESIVRADEAENEHDYYRALDAARAAIAAARGRP